MNAGEKQLQRLLRLKRRVAVTGGVLAALAAGWAVWPRSVRPPVTSLKPPPPMAAARPAAPFNLAVFGAPVWNPTPPPPPPPAEPVLPPLRLQLIGIVAQHPGGNARLRALIYDPDQDAMMEVGEGEMAAGRRVAKVLPDAVEVVDGGNVRRLTLPKEGGR